MSASRPWKGLDFDVLREAGVTIGDGGLVRVPYRLGSGRVHRERFFAPGGRTWWGPGEGLVPYGLETIPHDATDWALFLAEGESDTLALREAFAGTTEGHPMRGFCVLGLPGASSWRPEWSLIAGAFDRVYLIGDGDEAGQRMITKVYADVPWARPVWLPGGEDARSILQRDGNRALDPYLACTDADAKMLAAFLLAETIEECEALLRGEEVSRQCA